MSIRDDARVRKVFGAKGLGWLMARLRERVERGELLDGTMSLKSPSAEERDALIALLGRRPSRAGSITVNLDDLARRVREWEIADDLESIVDVLFGAVENRREVRAQWKAEWERLYTEAASEGSAVFVGALFVGELRERGLLVLQSRRDPERGRTLLEQLSRVAARLPAGGVPIAELAASTTGNSHALDADEPLGTLGVRYAARRAGLEDWHDADQRRTAWASVGVLVDELSAPVLVLNVRAIGDDPLARMLAIHADAGEPARISVRQLLRTTAEFERLVARPTVFVCENPSVVAAAANRLGARCAPMVCVDGNPKTPSRLLLRRMREAGLALRYHGDFDWPGIQIATRVIERLGAEPWRMGREDYEAVDASLALEGEPVDTPWDPTLRDAMAAKGRAVHEEQVMETLLGDLRS